MFYLQELTGQFWMNRFGKCYWLCSWMVAHSNQLNGSSLPWGILFCNHPADGVSPASASASFQSPSCRDRTQILKFILFLCRMGGVHSLWGWVFKVWCLHSCWGFWKRVLHGSLDEEAAWIPYLLHERWSTPCENVNVLHIATIALQHSGLKQSVHYVVLNSGWAPGCSHFCLPP